MVVWLQHSNIRIIEICQMNWLPFAGATSTTFSTSDVTVLLSVVRVTQYAGAQNWWQKPKHLIYKLDKRSNKRVTKQFDLLSKN